MRTLTSMIKTSEPNSIDPWLDNFYLPAPFSHKGDNGKVLVIGGSRLFHSASLWAAEIASHLVDIVHYSSTEENNQIFLSLKKFFRNGIVIKKEDLLNYVEEDDAILIGPGILRKKIKSDELRVKSYTGILDIDDEVEYTFCLIKYLIDSYPDKKFVFDAGALQIMDKQWLLKLNQPAVITPHQQEFNKLFGIHLKGKSINEKKSIVKKTAQEYHCVILLKAVVDIVSDGKKVYVIEGGNAGLTKGGTGDVLAGLVLALLAKRDQLFSAVTASYLLKKSGDELFNTKGYWYNIDDIMGKIPELMKKIIIDKN